MRLRPALSGAPVLRAHGIVPSRTVLWSERHPRIGGATSAPSDQPSFSVDAYAPHSHFGTLHVLSVRCSLRGWPQVAQRLRPPSIFDEEVVFIWIAPSRWLRLDDPVNSLRPSSPASARASP